MCSALKDASLFSVSLPTAYRYLIGGLINNMDQFNETNRPGWSVDCGSPSFRVIQMRSQEAQEPITVDKLRKNRRWNMTRMYGSQPKAAE